MSVNDIFHSIVNLSLDDRQVSVGVYLIEVEARNNSAAEMAELLATEVKDEFWTAYLKPLLSDELAYLGNKTQMVFPTREAPFLDVESSPIPGTLASPALNGTNAVIVAEYGSEWGARTRGRMYIPGLPESQASDGRITGTDYSPFQSAADTWYAIEVEPNGAGNGKYTPCVFSPAKPSATPPLGAVFSHPVTPVVRARIGTQRRRRTKVTSPS